MSGTHVCAETVGVICGEPPASPAEDIPAPVADLTGDEVPSPIPLDDVLAIQTNPRSDLRFLGGVAAATREVNRRSLILAAPTMGANPAMAVMQALGWRIRTTGEYSQALRNFQAGWNLGPPLTVDGVLGPVTSAALSVSLARRKAGLPTASARLSFAALACKCGGKYAGCQRIWVSRELVGSLEKYAEKVNSGPPVSACRCPGHNAAVGGVSQSQHLHGTAADVRYAVRDASVVSWRIAAGIGRSASTKLVRHIDRRDQSPSNPTRSTLAHPVIWDYAK